MPTCETCGGSGWNRDIKRKSVEIIAPLRPPFDLRALERYVRSRLCCPDCDGSGKIAKEEQK